MTDADVRRARIVAAARSWLGTPYHHQASLRGVGCDCLGLVRGIWRELYGEEPETPPPYGMDWAERSGEERLQAAALQAVPPGVAPEAVLRTLVRALSSDARVRSADIVEVDATADTPDQRTVRLAALCVLEMLAGRAARRDPS